MATTVPATVLSYFELADGFPWRDPRPQQIEHRRAAMGDTLLFDILLTAGGIREPDTLYPPSDVESFYRLMEAIHTSSYDALKRDCLVYFLLKWYQDGREDRYKLEKCIPPQFASLSDAYWHLDAGADIVRAVSILSDARLNTDYASKILQAISLSPNSTPLVLKYVRTAKPVLTEPDDIDIYAVALAGSSLLEAWQFQRTFSEKHETRPRLLRKILDWCLTSTPRRQALVQLLGIALTPYEQDLLQSYATPPSALPPTGIASLQNLLCVRLIQTGKYTEAIKMDRQFTSASSGKLGPQVERTKMVQDLYAALPLAERAILDLELENPGIQASTSGGTAMSLSSSRDWDMSMSWENIQTPVHPAPAAAIPHCPASRFRPCPRLRLPSREHSKPRFPSLAGLVQGHRPPPVFSLLALSALPRPRRVRSLLPLSPSHTISLHNCQYLLVASHWVRRQTHFPPSGNRQVASLPHWAPPVRNPSSILPAESKMRSTNRPLRRPLRRSRASTRLLQRRAAGLGKMQTSRWDLETMSSLRLGGRTRMETGTTKD
ncbi:nuclear pore complex assembly-domain-containing protein [Mycena galopus ATCC 62051]|nr:nuclear pore complex assembly-domain-containing protein [Mycena galopus ATCC 62051]